MMATRHNQSAGSRSRLIACGALAVIFAGLPVSGLQARDFQGQSFAIGETSLTPELRLDYLSTDNAFLSTTDPQEATAFVLSPSVNWVANRRLLELSASYRGKYASYSESVLDYTDHDLSLQVQAAPATRHRVGAELTLHQEHEELGTGQTQLDTNLEDQIVTTDVILNTNYAYGAVNAQGNVGGGLTLVSRSFNDVGPITEGDDYSNIWPYAYFSYRLSPDTRFRAEIRYAVLDYDEDLRDRSELTLLGGLDLAATSRSGGRVRLGVTNANYDNASVSDSTEFVADIDLYFKPKSYSRFDLTFQRNLDTVDGDPAGVAESVQDNATLVWTQDWTARITTKLLLETDRVDRTCPNIDTITDSAGLEVSVNIRRWIAVGAGVGTRQRSATACVQGDGSNELEFDETVYGLHVMATL